MSVQLADYEPISLDPAISGDLCADVWPIELGPAGAAAPCEPQPAFTAHVRHVPYELKQPLGRIERSLFIVWALVALSFAPAVWFLGRGAVEGCTAVAVVVQAALMLAILRRASGWWAAICSVLVIVSLTWSVELLGRVTGLPFGHYYYTEHLQPQLMGVPVLIALAWFIMLPPAWAVAALITRTWRGPAFWLTSGMALTAWDLFVDPQAVDWGWWVWTEPQGAFGVPATNYTGWVLVGTLLTALVRPRPLPVAPLVAVYAGMWIASSVGVSFFHQVPWAAASGFVAMGMLLLFAWIRTAQMGCRWGIPRRLPSASYEG